MSATPEVVVDYSYPMILAKAAIKKMQEAMLARRFDDAMMAGKVAIAELRIAVNAVHIEAEKKCRT